MIIPIHGLRYYNFKMPKRNCKIILVKEKNNPFDKFAIAAYNSQIQKIGYVGAMDGYNKLIYKIFEDGIIGKVWDISPNQILLELDLLTILPQKKKSTKKKLK
jgi:hypothetical protein